MDNKSFPPAGLQTYTGIPSAPDSAESASGPWSFWMIQSSSRFPARRTLVGNSHSNCKRNGSEPISDSVRLPALIYSQSCRHSPKIWNHEWVFEFGISARIEAVHPTKTLAGRPTTQHFHIALLRQLLAERISLLSRHDQFQEDITVLSEHRGAGIVKAERLCSWLPHLNSPERLRDTWRQ